MGEAFTFKGRVAVVTGAAQGIGFHSAKKLCENGMKVAFVDLNEEKVKQMAAAARSEERRVGKQWGLHVMFQMNLQLKP